MTAIRTSLPVFTIALLLLAAAAAASAQSLTAQDLEYGAALHNQIAASSPLLPASDIPPVLSNVFSQLAGTSVAKFAPIAPSLFYVRNGQVNAYAGAGGRVYVTDSFVQTVQGNAGIIAWAVGHEIAHNILQHGIEKYLRAVEEQQLTAALQYRVTRGVKGAEWQLIAYLATAKIAAAKMDRDQESEADRLGLIMAAQAGYHPAFGVLAARTLREKLGEQSKFSAFFSDHPRWTTREQRIDDNYSEALAAFSEHWPDAALSPGGLPPPEVLQGRAVAANSAPRLDDQVQDLVFEEGFQLMVAERYADAIQYFDGALAKSPTGSDLYIQRGNAYYHLGQYSRAIQDYEAAIALSPRSTLPYLCRGQAREKLGDKKGAAADRKRAEQLRRSQR